MIAWIREPWRAWLLIATSLTVVYFVAPTTPESKLVLYNGTGLLAVLAVGYGVKRNKPAQRAPWIWFAWGLSSFLVADVFYYILELANPAGPPFPSVADIFYLAMYPFVIVGLMKVHRSITADRTDSSLVITAIVGIAMMGVLWILFVDTVIEVTDHSTAGFITQLAYPFMDVALIAVAARLVLKVQLKNPPLLLILAAVSALAIADTAFGVYNTNGEFQTGTFIDGFWLAFYAFFGAASLHPASALPVLPLRSVEGRLTARQVAVMFAAAMTVLVIDLVGGDESDRLVTIVVSGTLIPLILGRVLILTRALEKSRDELHIEATHDALTGLPNRGLFTERTAAALHDNPDQIITVMFIDLDDFKTINDSLGHQAGDVLLIEVAKRLTACLRHGESVARLGGDEFAVLIEDQGTASVAGLARQILDTLTELVDVGPRSVPAMCSIGIASGTGIGTDEDTLLRNADVAMYLAKRRGKGRYELFDGEMHAEALERLNLQSDLQHALAKDQLVLHYQPIFDLETGRVTHTEALIRWRHPTQGLVGPDRFIPLAEENSLILDIGAWAIHQACSQTAAWRSIDGYEDLGVTVNLSMRQLQDQSLTKTLKHALRESGIPPSHLVFEITESMLALDIDRTVGILAHLKAIGVQLAIDDFGTGYSSLSYLRTFPIDAIKIDRTFIHELHLSPKAAALVKTIVNLAAALGTYTVAEGIETVEHGEKLHELGCDRGQGFHFCRPLAAGPLEQRLREHGADTDLLKAWPHSTQEARLRPYEVEVRDSLGEIGELASEMDDLSGELGLPFTTNWQWMHTWCDSFQEWSPLMIGARSRESGRLVGCALLATRVENGETRVAAMGAMAPGCAFVAATDLRATDAVAEAVAAYVTGLGDPWSLQLESVADFDAILDQLSERIDGAQLQNEGRVPRFLLHADKRQRSHILSAEALEHIECSAAAMQETGRQSSVEFHQSSTITLKLLDELETVWRRNQSQPLGRSRDRNGDSEFWRSVVEAGPAQWTSEIATLYIDGELAAFAVGVLDDAVYRILDEVEVEGFGDVDALVLLQAAVLDRVVDDHDISMLDWMCGTASGQFVNDDASETRLVLVASSAAESGSSVAAKKASSAKRRRTDAKKNLKTKSSR